MNSEGGERLWLHLIVSFLLRIDLRTSITGTSRPEMPLTIDPHVWGQVHTVRGIERGWFVPLRAS
jgi:hypothetical protein